ncbi:MAG: DUF4278 domain-containing protein [Leptolyngbyaceae bacterium]|nr:DUF4278 domain-containing protein [Leptolyngbyaceae bacterium]
MSMHYRGVTHEDNSKFVETKESDMIGHYRGACWKLREAKRNIAKHGHARLKYRGHWIDN